MKNKKLTKQQQKIMDYILKLSKIEIVDIEMLCKYNEKLKKQKHDSI